MPQPQGLRPDSRDPCLSSAQPLSPGNPFSPSHLSANNPFLHDLAGSVFVPPPAEPPGIPALPDLSLELDLASELEELQVEVEDSEDGEDLQVEVDDSDDEDELAVVDVAGDGAEGDDEGSLTEGAEVYHTADSGSPLGSRPQDEVLAVHGWHPDDYLSLVSESSGSSFLCPCVVCDHSDCYQHRLCSAMTCIA